MKKLIETLLTEQTYTEHIGVGNGKTLQDLSQQLPYFSKTFFCNAEDTTPVVGEVHLTWDEFNNCLGLYFPELESYLNLEVYTEEKWVQEYRTLEVYNIFKQAFDFFTQK